MKKYLDNPSFFGFFLWVFFWESFFIAVKYEVYGLKKKNISHNDILNRIQIVVEIFSWFSFFFTIFPNFRLMLMVETVEQLMLYSDTQETWPYFSDQIWAEYPVLASAHGRNSIFKPEV